MFTAVKNISRLFTIARTLARYDALWLLEEAGVAGSVVTAARIVSKRNVEGRPGERIAQALQELGPTFIKFGQALSTRSDLLGEEVAADLSELQDHLPPFSAADARKIIEQEMGQKVEESFSDFTWEPIAAASIAQVHFAITSEGEEVAVKVLRPNVEEAFAKDLALFHWIAHLVERARPELRRLKPIEVIETFEETIRLEMDLRLEAAAAQELAENFADDKAFRVPGVDWRRTTRRVLTLERVSGIPIDERDALIAAGHDPDEILVKAASSLFKQVFRDGFFHADQHPGNLFVGEAGEIVAVDFGIMGRLDKPTRRYLGEMLMSFLNRDYRRVAEVHFEAGYVPADKSVQAFTQACRSIAEPILDKPQNEISIARLLAHLFQVTETFEMETQPQLLLLQKTMLTSEGVGRTLSPDANMWFLAQPLIEEWVEENMGPETMVMEAVGEVAEGLRRLPRIVSDMEKNAAAMAKGGLKLHPDTIRGMAGGERSSLVTSPKLYIGIIALLVVLLLIT
ncbi:MAG: 2-polyprenylphenol 6-hydroxylase [Rhodospirillaceae bacterium]|jgi:ubiquinone biosynthesis protein|nr:2-polyprenylphenol 6-hydroxylase [Rhodospirillaceae bacterium]MBT5939803.1 2-polyprenylphenol 6-hydroxylase [Rhodospirillaceae bacterium]MBT7266028.1 2-polyprenylphenol 6-hydroxylase [Rhodospirillaceae bacterium]